MYKGAYSHAEARKIILDESGSHFDPDVVYAFQKCEQKFLSICQRYSEERGQTGKLPPLEFGKLDDAVDLVEAG